MVKEVCMEKLLSDATENFTTGFMCSESVLEVLNRVECVLQRARYVVLDILGTRTVVICKHHDGVCLNIRHQVDGEL